MSAFDRMTDERDAALRRIAEIEAERDALKAHAEAMYGALVAFGIEGGNLEQYRRDFPEEDKA